MGNQMSSQDDRYKEEVNQNAQGKILDKSGKIEKNSKEEALLIKDTYSSYKGVKTDTTDNDNTNGDKSISNDTTSVVTAQEAAHEVKIQTLFEWKDGGHMVYVAGSFSNWTQWFVMRKNNSTGNFELVLDLPKGVHQYKFIVDNKWVYSKQHPTSKDEGGNINNIMDLNQIVAPKIQEKEVEKEKTPPRTHIEELKKNLTETYTEYFPSKSELNLDAPNSPVYYASPFNIDYYSHQNSIGHKNYLDFTMPNDVNGNNSFKKITLTPHVNLNHLITNCKFKKGNDTLTTSTVHRVRNKFLTIMYYKPLV